MKKIFMILSIIIFVQTFCNISYAAETDDKIDFTTISYSYDGKMSNEGYCFEYSDSLLLEGDAENLSGELAKASVGLAVAAYGKDGNAVKSSLMQMGVNEDNIITNGSYDTVTTITNNDTVAYTIAMKKVGHYYIYIVPIRGTPSSPEWYSDLNLGTTGNHAGFYTAAKEVLGRLMEKIKSDGADKEHTIIWTMGHSRGAAVANIVAGKLSDSENYATRNHIFGYTFACPAVSKYADITYSNIYNYNFPGDLIAELPLEDWGYKRYGVSIDGMDSQIYQNEILQFTRITGKDFAAIDSTDAYINTLKEFVKKEDDYNSQAAQFAFTMAGYALGGKNNTSLDELVGYIGMNISNDYAEMLSQKFVTSSNITNEFMDASILDLQAKLNKAETELDLMNETEQEQWIQNNSDLVDEIERRFKEEIIDTSDIITAKTRVDKCVKTMNTVTDVYNCIMGILVDTNGKPTDAIFHAHTPETYIVWMNSLFCGYRGWYQNKDVDLIDNLVGVETIGENCFSGCTLLKNIEMPETLKKIQREAFYECSYLEEIVLPNSLRRVENRAFYKCSGIKTVTLPVDLEYSTSEWITTGFQHTWISYASFANCTSIEKIIYTTGKTGIMPDGKCRDEANNYNYKEWLLGVVSDSLKEVEFEEGVKNIGDYAFCNRKQLKKIVIPDTVTSIGKEAFYRCESLDELYLSENIDELGYHAFGGCTGIKMVTLPVDLDYETGLVYSGLGWNVSPFWGCKNIEIVEYLKGKTGVMSESANHNYTILGVGKIKEVIFHDGIKNIASYALYGKDQLEYVMIPKTVDSIGEYAFYNCKSLKAIDVSNVKEIPEYAFYKCEALETIDISNVTKISSYAFYNCKSLKIIDISNVKDISGCAFENCANLEIIKFPNKVEGTIGGYAFCGCTSLQTAILPDNVMEVGDFAFSSCASLQIAVIPDGIETIGKGVFKNCTSLEDVTMPADLEYVASGSDSCTFYGCTGVKKVHYTKGKTGKMPDYNDWVGTIAWEAGASLESVILDEGIVNVGDYTFYSNDCLINVKFPDSVTGISDMAFLNEISATFYGKKDSVVEEYANEKSIAFIPLNYPMIIGDISEMETDSTRQFSAKVYTDVEQYTEDVTWSLEGNISEETSISSSGLLTVSSSESTRDLEVICQCNDVKSNVSIPIVYHHWSEDDTPPDVDFDKIRVSIDDNKLKIYIPAKDDLSGLAYVETYFLIFNKDTNMWERLGFAYGWTRERWTVLQDGYVVQQAFDQFMRDAEGYSGHRVASTDIFAINDIRIQDAAGNVATGIDYTATGIDVPSYLRFTMDKAELIPEEGESSDPKPGTLDKDSDTTQPEDSTTLMPKGEQDNQSMLPMAGITVTVSTGIYKVTKSTKTGKEAAFIKPKSSKKSAITIPDTIKINGFTYKVTSIAPNVFANNKKLTKVTVGKNVTSIGKNAFKNCKKLKSVTLKSTSLKTIGSNAFYGDKNLKTITIKSTKLTSKSVGKNALKGTNKKLTIKVSKKKISSYKKFLKKKGNTKVTVKKG